MTGPEPTGFTATLRREVDRDWTAAVYHRLADRLLDGSLPVDVQRTYFVQDAFFVDGFTALLGAALAYSDNPDARIVLGRQIGIVVGAENTFFENTLRRLGVDEETHRRTRLAPATEAFNGLLGEAIGSGQYAVCLSVLLVAEWLYLEWARRAFSLPDDPVYRAWISLHDNPEFEAWVDWLRIELDRVALRLDEPGRAECLRYFRLATRMERDFFEMAAVGLDHGESPKNG